MEIVPLHSSLGERVTLLSQKTIMKNNKMGIMVILGVMGAFGKSGDSRDLHGAGHRVDAYGNDRLINTNYSSSSKVIQNNLPSHLRKVRPERVSSQPSSHSLSVLP